MISFKLKSSNGFNVVLIFGSQFNALKNDLPTLTYFFKLRQSKFQNFRETDRKERGNMMLWKEH